METQQIITGLIDSLFEAICMMRAEEASDHSEVIILVWTETFGGGMPRDKEGCAVVLACHQLSVYGLFPNSAGNG